VKPPRELFPPAVRISEDTDELVSRPKGVLHELRVMLNFLWQASHFGSPYETMKRSLRDRFRTTRRNHGHRRGYNIGE
jgi:hypothetical protein